MTSIHLHDADRLRTAVIGLEDGKLALPRPKANWIWIVAIAESPAAKLSITAGPHIRHSSRAVINGETISSWLLEADGERRYIAGLENDIAARCYIGSLPSPLDALVARSDTEVSALAEMLAIICMGAPLDTADLRDLTAVQSFDLLRGSAAIARRLGFFQTEADLLQTALTISRSPNILRLLSYAYANAQNYAQAITAADEALRAKSELADGPFAAHLAELSAYREIGEELTRAPPARTPRESRGTTIAYCLHNALPHTQGGYAMRSHAVARAISDENRDLMVFTRPGFPSDGADAHGSLAETEIIDGVRYFYENGFGRRGRAYSYIADAANYFEQVFARHAIGIVHAATNFWTALPAAIAARRLGLPFIYEVRSFWSITREARSPGFAQTPQARRDDALEAIALAMADHVITLNDAMRRKLIDIGVDTDRISLAPNGVDAIAYTPGPRDPELAHRFGIAKDAIVVGYMGAMLTYEGIDLLIEAMGPIAKSDPRIHLLIVGADPEKRQQRGTIEYGLSQRIETLDAGGRITLIDRVPPTMTGQYYRLFDICAYPRRAFEVCELVSPLKPLEAMAAGKTVVASDVHALQEMVDEDRTGLLFAKDNVVDLRTAMMKAIADEALRARVGTAARSFVRTERNWAHITQEITRTYDGIDDAAANEGSDIADLIAQHFAVPAHDSAIFSKSGANG